MVKVEKSGEEQICGSGKESTVKSNGKLDF